MSFATNIAGKIVTGVATLGVIVLGISWWQTDAATRQMILSAAGKIAAWLGVVLVLPWASFFVVGRVARLDNNAAGAALVAVYTLLEVALLAWMFYGSITGPTAWTFAAVGVLFAAVYNLFTCDWIAEKLEG